MCTDPSCRHRNKRKLRPLVISLIPKDDDDTTATSSNNNTLRRYEQITKMFTTHPSLSKHFEAPTFSQGVPSRELRGRLNFLRHANIAGLIPDIEWEAICKGIDEQIEDITAKDNEEDTKENEKQHKTIDPFRYLATETLIQQTNTRDSTEQQTKQKKKKHWLQYETKTLIPISPNRRGSPEDIAIPYSMELWRKAKTLNRDRSVLACTFAHLMAMKRIVGDKHDGALNDDNEDLEYDFILEDNVRAFLGIDNEDTKYGCECANRIWDIIEASNNASSECHLRYFGWLGSLPNLNWVYNNHMKRSQLNETTSPDDDECIIFPFPTNDDFLLDSIDATSKVNSHDDKISGQTSSMPQFSTPGGTAVFGTFAYTISPSCYHTLINTLQNDVGQLMWKGKRMRAYQAKPIDKILPRHVKTEFSPFNIHIPNKVAFVRAPMLGSLLHPQWEEGFCSSTELQYQLSCGNQDDNDNSNDDSVWDHVWLTQEEREMVSHRKKTGKWLQKGDIVKTERSRNTKPFGVPTVLPLTIMMISFLSLALSDAFLFNSQSIYCGCNVRYKSRSMAKHTQLESEDITLNTERKKAKLGKVPIISRTIPLEVIQDDEDTKKLNVTVWEMDKPSDLIQEWWSIDDSERKSRVGDPFGVVMWPGSILASNELMKKHYSAQVSPLKNATVLVLGAGTGVEAQTAALLGAKVVATDISPLTLKLLEHGAEVETRIDNTFEARYFDLFSDDVLPECDILIAADVLYNPELASQVGRRLYEAIVRSFEEGLPPTKIICTDSQQFHQTNFLKEVEELQELNNMFKENNWEHLKWVTHKLDNVCASGVLVDDDQVYDVNVRMICWG